MNGLPTNLYLNENTEGKKNLCNHPETENTIFPWCHCDQECGKGSFKASRGAGTLLLTGELFSLTLPGSSLTYFEVIPSFDSPQGTSSVAGVGEAVAGR